MKQTAQLESNLDDFDPAIRTQALQTLVSQAQQGTAAKAPRVEVANMHCHTFHSYNGYGYSPTALAWLGKTRGFRAMGIVDFDVLDGVDEFLDAMGANAVIGVDLPGKGAEVEADLSTPEGRDVAVRGVLERCQLTSRTPVTRLILALPYAVGVLLTHELAWLIVEWGLLLALLPAGIALALTFPVWLTVNYLGNPDNGAILAGYVGSFLLAGLALTGCAAPLAARARPASTSAST